MIRFRLYNLRFAGKILFFIVDFDLDLERDLERDLDLEPDLEFDSLVVLEVEEAGKVDDDASFEDLDLGADFSLLWAESLFNPTETLTPRDFGKDDVTWFEDFDIADLERFGDLFEKDFNGFVIDMVLLIDLGRDKLYASDIDLLTFL